MKTILFIRNTVMLGLVAILLLPSCQKEDVRPTENQTQKTELSFTSEKAVLDQSFEFNPDHEGGCVFPGIQDYTCNPEEPQAALVEYGMCLEGMYGDPENMDDDPALLALAGLVFYAITEASEGDEDAFNSRKSLLACAAAAIGAEDAKKLLVGLKEGRISKKHAFRLVKKNIKKLFGFFGIAIAICEFIACLAS